VWKYVFTSQKVVESVVVLMENRYTVTFGTGYALTVADTITPKVDPPP
jgi:hypothetical protein